ncbi:hypothetical protein [Streptomyces sp. XC 2026]|uniref:hypothetical protein n=1 Tax=Streptomyces sp. XC 2026 TaxID=2782004 RepID=UPI00190614AD|nr:hypothetical protein [Streptomyces sp. XC 2026]QQN79732.1 hypothetical protein IPZ77_21640 [Streptomyces sp. XC 2026]QQN80660.1 hypothetical protein IPZ77_27015 [Streptomyces sp. XC 2026]
MTAVTFAGRPTVGGVLLRCPGSGAGKAPSKLTLLLTGSQVRAKCGGKHGTDGEKAGCFWVVPGVTGADLAMLAKAPSGKVEVALASGKVLTGKLLPTEEKKEKGDGEKLGIFGRLMAAAKPTPPGKAAATVPAKTAPSSLLAPRAAGRQSSGGTAVAAFGALSAAFNAVGQTAQAGARIVGSTADVAKGGLDVVKGGIGAVNDAGARDLVRFTHQQQAQTGPAPISMEKRGK